MHLMGTNLTMAYSSDADVHLCLCLCPGGADPHRAQVPCWFSVCLVTAAGYFPEGPVESHSFLLEALSLV